jgi:hypothetical protein
MPFLDLFQAITFRFSHEQHNHHCRSQTTPSKKIVRAKRRLIKKYRCYKRHDIVRSLKQWSVRDEQVLVL